MAKISHRKLSEILKRFIYFRKTSVLESVFNKTAGIDSTESIDSEINSIDLQLYRKKAYSKVDFAVGTSEFSALFLKDLT